MIDVFEGASSAWRDDNPSRAELDRCLAQRASAVIAGVAANLAGRLRDYRAHFSLDVEEMGLCVQLWRLAVLELQPRASSFVHGKEPHEAYPRAGLELDDLAAVSAQAALEEQVCANIDERLN